MGGSTLNEAILNSPRLPPTPLGGALTPLGVPEVRLHQRRARAWITLISAPRRVREPPSRISRRGKPW
jgi:hypothetical protein